MSNVPRLIGGIKSLHDFQLVNVVGSCKKFAIPTPQPYRITTNRRRGKRFIRGGKNGRILGAEDCARRSAGSKWDDGEHRYPHRAGREHKKKAPQKIDGAVTAIVALERVLRNGELDRSRV